MHAVPTMKLYTLTAGESILVSHRNPDDNTHSARVGGSAVQLTIL